MNSSAPTEKETFVGSTTRGALWNSLAYWLSKVALLPTTVILARLLSPTDFGLLALALIVLTYLDVLREFGLSTALIQWPDDDDLMVSVAFWLSVVFGVVTAAGAVLLAPTIAGFFRQPELTAMLRVLALTFVVDSAAGVYEARIRKRLQFRRRVGPELARALVKGVTAIALAFLGAGVWSLILGQVAGSLVAAALYVSVSHWVPAWRFDLSIARSLLAYGSQLLMFTVLAVVIKDVDYLIIGRRISAEALGFYTLAFRLPELAILGTCYIFSQTVFPVFARLQQDADRLGQAFLRTVQILLLVTLPLGVGMSLLAPEVVQVVFSERWLPSVAVLRWLALYASVVAVGFVVGDVYKATGRTGMLNGLAVLKLGVTLPVLWVAASHGIEKVALGQLAVISVIVFIELTVALRILDLPSSKLLGSVAAPIASALAMAAVVLAGRWLLPGGSPLLRLAVLGVLGALAYAASVMLLARAAVVDIARAGGLKSLESQGTA